MTKNLLGILFFLLITNGHAAILMDGSMNFFKKKLEERCPKEVNIILTKDLFYNEDDFLKFNKQVDELLISKPQNACDLLKHPKILSAVSIVPRMEYINKESEYKTDAAKRIEIEYSRKFYVFKLLLLKEKVFSIEKEVLEKKQALSILDFHMKLLVACMDSKCPSELFELITKKIPRKTSGIVYGQPITQLFLKEDNILSYFEIRSYFEDNVNLSYDNSFVLKQAMLNNTYNEYRKNLDYVKSNYPESFVLLNVNEWREQLYSKEKIIETSISLNELEMEHFVSKNTIGFAMPYSLLVHYSANWGSTTKEITDSVEKSRTTYRFGWVAYSQPDWKSEVKEITMVEEFKRQEIRYEVDYLKVYGVVNSVKGNWFLIKDEKNNSYWVNQAQFYATESISSILLNSYLSDGIKFYESPAGTLMKKTTAELPALTFKAKAFKWIKDQLWVMIETAEYEPCDSGGYEQEGTTNGVNIKRLPVSNVWIKAFNDKGDYNFMHAARGC